MTATPLVAGLLAGHMLADFVFQTRRMVEGKTQLRWLLAHGAVLLTVHAVVLFPLLSTPILLGLVAIAVLHVVIDRLKVALSKTHGETLPYFAIDQLLHIAALIALAHFVSPPPFQSRLISAEDYRILALLVAGLAFMGTGGAAVVRLLLQRVALEAPPGPGVKAGRTIGILERYLIFLFMWVGAWTAVGLVLAAKGIARHDELSHRPFAEYYLVGTLASTLVAVGTALLLLSLR